MSYADTAAKKRDFWIGVVVAAIFVVVYVTGGWFDVFEAWLPRDALRQLREWPMLAGLSFLVVYGYRRWPLALGGVVAVGLAFVLQFGLLIVVWGIAGD